MHKQSLFKISNFILIAFLQWSTNTVKLHISLVCFPLPRLLQYNGRILLHQRLWDCLYPLFLPLTLSLCLSFYLCFVTLFILFFLFVFVSGIFFPRFPVDAVLFHSFSLRYFCVYAFTFVVACNIPVFQLVIRLEMGKSHKFFITKSECDTRCSRVPVIHTERQYETLSRRRWSECFLPEQFILACVTVFFARCSPSSIRITMLAWHKNVQQTIDTTLYYESVCSAHEYHST